MVFIMVIAVGMPVILTILVKKKAKMRIGPLFTGACAYIMVVMFAQNAVGMILVLSKPMADFFMANQQIYAVVRAVVDSVIQVLGIVLVMKFLMKDFLRKENALLFGIGLGAVDSIFNYASGAYFNFSVATQINKIGLEQFYSMYEGETLESAKQQIEILMSYQPLEIFGLGIMDFFLIILQIALAVLIFLAVKREGKMHLLPTAMGLCGLELYLRLLRGTNVIQSITLYLILMGLVCSIAAVIAFFFYRADSNEERGRADTIMEKRVYQQQASAPSMSMKEKIAKVSKVTQADEQKESEEEKKVTSEQEAEKEE